MNCGIYAQIGKFGWNFKVGYSRLTTASYISDNDARGSVMHRWDESDDKEIYYLRIALCASASAWSRRGVEKGRCLRSSKGRRAGGR